MTLDKGLEKMLADMAALPALWEFPAAKARALAKQFVPMSTAPAREEIGSVTDIQIPSPAGGIPARIYAPKTTVDSSPVLVYFHGGGWVIGDLESHDALCREFCEAIDCIVVAVDYRLAPEHKFPAAVEDAWTAVQWIAAHAAEFGGDASRLAVGGDSAGGNLTAVVTQKARDEGGPAIIFQLLLYPALDVLTENESRTQFETGYSLDRTLAEWFLAQYLDDIPTQAPDLRVSPGKAENLAGLPQALIITAGFDPLKDEGKAYADRLRDAGVAVEYICYDTVIHGFMTLTAVTPVAYEAIAYAAAALQAAFVE